MNVNIVYFCDLIVSNDIVYLCPLIVNVDIVYLCALIVSVNIVYFCTLIVSVDIGCYLLSPEKHLDEWLEAGEVRMGPVLSRVFVATSELKMNKMQEEFLRFHDRKTRRLYFLWDVRVNCCFVIVFFINS